MHRIDFPTNDLFHKVVVYRCQHHFLFVFFFVWGAIRFFGKLPFPPKMLCADGKLFFWKLTFQFPFCSRVAQACNRYWGASSSIIPLKSMTYARGLKQRFFRAFERHLGGIWKSSGEHLGSIWGTLCRTLWGVSGALGALGRPRGDLSKQNDFIL